MADNAPPAVADDDANDADAVPPPPVNNLPRPVTGIRPPLPLSVSDTSNLPDVWKMFKQKWRNYETIIGLQEQPRAYQVALFLHTIGDEALRIYNGFTFVTQENQRTVDEIIAEFDGFCIGEVNLTYERYMFNSRNQREGETFDAFLSAVRTLVKTCGYCINCVDSLLRDRIVLGVRDPGIQTALLKERNITLAHAIDLCKAAENATAHHKLLNPDSVNKLSGKPSRGPRPQASSVRSDKPSKHDRSDKASRSDKSSWSKKSSKPARFDQQPRQCKFCDTTHIMLKSECPAYGKICSNCHKANHFASKCPQRRIRQIQEDSESSSSEDEWIAALASNTSPSTRDIKCKLLLNKTTEVAFLIDTGSTVNVLPISYQPPDIPLNPVNKTLYSWNNSTVTALGSCRHSVKNPVNNKKYSVEFIVVKENLMPILGLRATQAMKLVTVNDNSFERVATVTLDKFADVFDGKLGTIPGDHHLQVDPSVQPVVMADRRVPLSVRPQLKAELDRMTKLGVIKRVDEPTPWISQLVLVTKKSGALRVCIDPRELNRALLRERYTLPVLEDVVHNLGKSAVFTKADLSQGYWHIALDTESSMLTTFQTPEGRYRWLRLPFGTCVSSEIFQRRLLQTLEGLRGVVCIADDIIIHGRDTQEHDRNLVEFMQRCQEVGIKLNKDKLELRKNSISFLGHRVSSKGLEADPNKVKAITNMDPPADLKQLRTFIGMVNYLVKFLPNLSATLKPLTNLTKADVSWNWSSVEQQAFEEIKTKLTQAPILAFYDPNKPLTLENDASEFGIGSVLKQEGKPVAFASRMLTDCERRYAQIEKEMLAVLYGLDKFHHYVFGRRVHIITDHQPLVSIVKKPLSKAPKRLQHMLLRSQMYDYTLEHKPGSAIPVADALSRAPLENPAGKEREMVNNLTLNPIKKKPLEQLRETSRHDEEMQQLMHMITSGWPQLKDDVPLSLKPYFSVRDELTVQDCLVMRGERFVVPKPLRKMMKVRSHAGHLGINSTLRRARDLLYWPNMSSEIREHVESCGTCASMATKQAKETVISQETTERPWQRVGSDIMQFEGQQYLITADSHSGYFEVDHLKDIRAETVITLLKKNFARHGIPDTLITDSGSQYTSEEFRRFKASWEFEHLTSSPGNHQANGIAEAAVKTAKRLFKKCRVSNEDPYLGLLNLRNTPHEATNSSPAQKLFGRRTQAHLPGSSIAMQAPKQFRSKVDKDDYMASKVVKMNNVRRDLRPLQPGQTVRMEPIDNTKEWKEAVVKAKTNPRTYEVETAEGKTYKRNRKFLRSSTKSTHHQQVPAVPCTSEHPVQHESEKPSTKPSTEQSTESAPRVESPNRQPSNDSTEHPSSPVQQHTRISRYGRTIKTPKRFQ